jgi:gp16 family phage-associated protein
MITQEQLKKDFAAKGMTYAQWAKDNNYPEYAVYNVISGVNKAARGRAHEIAVKLGLKDNPDLQTASTH